MVQADFESTKEEKTLAIQLPDQPEAGCVGNLTKKLFPGDLSSPTSSYCSLRFQTAVMLMKGGGTSPPCLLHLQQPVICLPPWYCWESMLDNHLPFPSSVFPDLKPMSEQKHVC